MLTSSSRRDSDSGFRGRPRHGSLNHRFRRNRRDLVGMSGRRAWCLAGRAAWVRWLTVRVVTSEKDHTGASQAGATASPEIPEGRTVTYQLILRHLWKFRDVPRRRSTFSPPRSSRRCGPGCACRFESFRCGSPQTGREEPKSPLEIRIQRHMSRLIMCSARSAT